MFVINQWETQHHILKNAQQVPQVLRDAKRLFGKNAKFEHHIWDVDSCYPSMPRQDIVRAMQDILDQTVAQDRGAKRKFILVPRNKHEKPQWGNAYTEDVKATHMKLEYKDMIDVLRFSLTNAVCKLGTRIIRQTKGIPQGDSLSPAVCIGTLAWYENKWMGKLTQRQRNNIKVARYLDDVLFLANCKEGDHKGIIDSYKKNCYPAGLSLEGDEGENNFLETLMVNTGNNLECRHRNKNANMGTQEFYRGKHAWSYNEERHKMGAMIGTFTRIKRNSSNDDLALESVLEKVQELQTLNYTRKQCERALKYLANKHATDQFWQSCLSMVVDTNKTLGEIANDVHH